MIVTCDHCGARYKLDENKISGRGAKITCPRCRHVFVVYRKGAAPAGAEAEPAPQAAAAAAQTDFASTPTGSGMALASPTKRPPPPPPPPPTQTARPSDVHGLDFRKVGIPSWKVKVKIGLVYDFSDYKTLAKYITDGRVTDTDLLSHDGKTWNAIGELGDLEEHFIDVYVAASQAQEQPAVNGSAAGVSDFGDEDDPTMIVGMNSLANTIGGMGPDSSAALAAATAAASAEVEGGRALLGPDSIPPASGTASVNLGSGSRTGNATGPGRQFDDPFESLRRSRKGERSRSRTVPVPAPAAPSAAGGGGSKLPMVVGALLLVGAASGGVWFYLHQLSTPTPVQPTFQPTASPPGKAAAPDRRQEILDELERSAETTAEDDIHSTGEQELIPVGPRGGSPVAPSNTPLPPSGASSAPLPPPPAAAPPAAAPRQSTAGDHVAIGNSALASGDMTSATMAFREALKLDPNNAQALKGLGQIAEQNGDVSGALGYYQQYVGTNPPDKAAYEQRIKSLSGQ